jgi:hypothetical protein
MILGNSEGKTHAGAETFFLRAPASSDKNPYTYVFLMYGTIAPGQDVPPTLPAPGLSRLGQWH